jgi:hypothetical protein
MSLIANSSVGVLLLAACGGTVVVPAYDLHDNAFMLELLRADGRGLDQRYQDPARYVASLTCSWDDDVSHTVRRRHTLEGSFIEGQIVLYPPACCRQPALLEIAVWPADLVECQATVVGPLDMSSGPFAKRLSVRVLCGALARSPSPIF